jgi:hypothetical protein
MSRTLCAICSSNPVNELALRSLEMDDIAWSSLLYQEGSETTGPGALQPGDQAFDAVFGLVTGRVRHGKLRQPVAGASVFAVDAHSGAVVSSAISGTTQCRAAQVWTEPPHSPPRASSARGYR